MITSAYANDKNQFEFGQITGPCLYQACQITFEKTGYQDPLIFLMPSFSEPHWNDAPATLRVLSVSTTSATIKQFIAPYNHKALTLATQGGCGKGRATSKTVDQFLAHYKSWCIEAIPMRNISYFVIENGADINLGKYGRIIAHRETINQYIKGGISLKKEKNKAMYAKKITDGSLSGKYGVIVEIQDGIPQQQAQPVVKVSQTVLPASLWITPSIEFLDDHVYLSLDRSEVGGLSSTYRDVAYLAVQGQGVYKGLSFALGQDSTFDSVEQGDKDWKGIVSSPYNQCQQVTDINYFFSQPPFLLASKNSRLGVNGGFLRLCKASYHNGQAQVSFVTDEDLNESSRNKLERNHHEEFFGYMAFQQVVSPEVCELFPGPAQTWDTRTGRLVGSHHIMIKGAYLDPDNRRYLGFPQIINSSSDAPNTYCSGTPCYPAINKPNLYAKKKTLQTWPANSDGAFGDGSTIDMTKNVFWFESVYLNQGGHYQFPNKSVIHTRNLSLNNLSRLSAVSGLPDDLIIYVHQLSDARGFIDVNKGSQLSALIYSEQPLSMTYDHGGKAITKITGAVTAPEITMSGKRDSPPATVIEGNSACFETDPNYVLDIIPPQATTTLCHAQAVTFMIKTSDGSVSDYQGRVQVSIDSPFGGMWSAQADFSSPQPLQQGKNTLSLTVTDNQAQIWLKGSDVEAMRVDATIDNMINTPEQGVYHFIPGGFAIALTPSHHIVAGQSFDATLTAMTCPEGENSLPIKNYTGTKRLDFSTQYQRPASSSDPLAPIMVEIIKGAHIDEETGATIQADVMFEQGRSEPLTLKYRDAGVIIWHVADPNCNDETCVPLSANTEQDKAIRTQLPQGLTGSVLIHARPWMFAICPLTFNGKNQFRLADGTADRVKGEGYTAANNPFDLLLKPLVWQPDADLVVDQGVIDVSDQKYCGYSVTENFLAPDAPVMGGGLQFSTALHTPISGTLGVYRAGTTTINRALKGLLVKQNRWSETGSIWLTASMQNYLGMDINPSRRHIGRFYPKYIAFSDDSVVTPAFNHQFTYMDQPFAAAFTVYAFDVNHRKLKNYAAFIPPLQTQLQLASGNNSGPFLPLDARLKHQTSEGELQTPTITGWQRDSDGYAQAVFAPHQLVFQRQYHTATTTVPDGPYQQWQLRVTQQTLPDKVTWQSEDVNDYGALVGSNDLRYGRMVLADTHGDMNTPLAVPLRVEYWDGEAFIRNHDDSYSVFNGDNYCRQVIQVHPSGTSSHAYTVGAGTVTTGQARIGQLMAHPHSPHHHNPAVFQQKIRFWQRVSAIEPKAKQSAPITCFGQHSHQPWLRYNWRQTGDEDPSAVIIFGLYRGNDRIIYRDEPGVSAQGYQ